MTSNWIVLMAIAAVSHASWNFFLKQSANKIVFLWSLRFWALVIFAVVAAVLRPGLPAIHWLYWGAGSAALHCLYSLLLVKAYEGSELALAYPIARGTAPLVAVLVGWLFLGEGLRIASTAGALLVVVGIVLLYAAPHHGAGMTPLAAMVASPWPLLVGLGIAGYTIFDKLAVAHVPPVSLNVMQNIGQVSILGLLTFGKVGPVGVIDQWRRYWPRMLLSGFFVGLAYVLVLVVMTTVPVSRVAPVREASILCGAILGHVFLKERLGARGLLGAFLIFCGVVAAAY
ncbi:MAG: EamA family transporter [Bacteroidota bacterium]